MAFELFVNGGLMRGLRGHAKMAGATLIADTVTAPRYRLHSINNDRHPGMFEVADREDGVSVAGELYSVPEHVWAVIEAGEPPGLYKGPVTLMDGRTVDGILYPRELAEASHPDITEYGSWRAYLAANNLPG